MLFSSSAVELIEKNNRLFNFPSILSIWINLIQFMIVCFKLNQSVIKEFYIFNVKLEVCLHHQSCWDFNGRLHVILLIRVICSSDSFVFQSFGSFGLCAWNLGL